MRRMKQAMCWAVGYRGVITNNWPSYHHMMNERNVYCIPDNVKYFLFLVLMQRQIRWFFHNDNKTSAVWLWKGLKHGDTISPKIPWNNIPLSYSSKSDVRFIALLTLFFMAFFMYVRVLCLTSVKIMIFGARVNIYV